MIIAVDVDYKGSEALVAGVAFNAWRDEVPSEVFTTTVSGVAEYEPGEFYKRELPCILKLLQDHKLNPEFIVVDGFAYLNGYNQAGLGKHLYDALSGKSIVLGVAKRSFKGISSKYALQRGESKNPVFVTSVGMDSEEAKMCIATMAGVYRIPSLLKKADQACRGRA